MKSTPRGLELASEPPDVEDTEAVVPRKPRNSALMTGARPSFDPGVVFQMFSVASRSCSTCETMLAIDVSDEKGSS